MALAFLRRHDSIGWLFVAWLLRTVCENCAGELLPLYLLVPWIWRRVARQSALLAVALLVPLVAWRELSALRVGSGIARLPADVPFPLVGKSVLITGSSSGIGFFAAGAFFYRGAHVVVHGSHNKTQVAADLLRAVHVGGPGRLTAMPFDLEDFEEVRSAAARLREVTPQIHFLVLNAGIQDVQELPNITSKSGHDKAMSINHLSHFLLLSLLEDILAPGARIVVVSSGGSYYGWPEHLAPAERLPWEDPSFRGRFPLGARQAYQDSKLANVCFGRSLQRRLAGRASTVLFDPGFVMTRALSAFQEHPVRHMRWTYGPASRGGENLLQACFVEPVPMAPDWVISYFLPRESIAQWVHWSNLERLLWNRLQTFWEFSQQLTNGLHVTIGPLCPEPLQDKLWTWSAQAVGIAP